MKITIKILLGLTLAVIGSQAQALLITGLSLDECAVDPNCYSGPQGAPAAQPSTSDLVYAIDDQGGGTVNLFDVYKENVGDGFDTGEFSDSYETTFTNTADDPNDALIKWVGPDTLNCAECFLLVKDGVQKEGTLYPNWYLFDISSWDGTDDIILQDFWVGTGGISNVMIFDNGTNVPEPGMLALLSIGLLGFSLRNLKKSS